MDYNADWHDMSDYVVHFSKTTAKSSAYDNMLSILASQVLQPGRSFGIARSRAPEPESQLAVCFSEIPLDLLLRLANKRGDYGIGFPKKLMRERQVGPIWYVEKDGLARVALEQLMARGDGNAADPIWNLTPLIDAPGEYPTGTYRFEWEREWRSVGNFRFQIDDVAFLILPEEYHEAARSFFENAVDENTGPGYFCPYIDPRWGRDRVNLALGKR